jgi:hypothetical protein
VSAGVEVFVPSLQPVSTALITMPNSTISEYILFIVGLPFTKSLKRTSTILRKARGGPARDGRLDYDRTNMRGVSS